MTAPVRRDTIRRQRNLRPILHGRTHGRRSTYNDGCGCDPCRDAEALYSRPRWRQRKANR